MPKTRKEPINCTYCGKEVQMKVNGGKVKIPVSITLGQFREYNQAVIVHNTCIKPLINRIYAFRN